MCSVDQSAVIALLGDSVRHELTGNGIAHTIPYPFPMFREVVQLTYCRNRVRFHPMCSCLATTIYALEKNIVKFITCARFQLEKK